MKNNMLINNISLMKEYNYSKNIDINLNELSLGSNKKIWWICKKGHEWESTPNNRKNGNGCPYCSNRKILPGYNDLESNSPELAREWDYKKNKNLIPKNISCFTSKKVWWKCKKGHSYEASIYARYVKKNGCPYCSNHRLLKGYNDLKTINPNLVKEWNYEKNGTLKPDNILFGSSKKVWWKCKNGHEWEATIKHRINGTNCPFCSNERHISVPEKITYFYLKKYFKDALENYSPNGFGKRDLDIFIPSINTGVEYDGSYYHENLNRDLEKNILCKKNNIKLYRIRDPQNKKLNDYSKDIHLKKYSFDELSSAINDILVDLNINNPDININRDLTKVYDMMDIYDKEHSLKEINPTLAEEWNYEKNGTLTPDKVLFGSTKVVWWKCKNGHEWQERISSRKGCPYCCNQKVSKGYNDLQTKNPVLAEEWNYEKNRTLTPDKVIPYSNKKVWWICSKGHEWQATINSRSRGTGCPICSNKTIETGYNDLKTLSPDLVKEWNYKKNEDLKPDNISNGSSKKVWWICEKGHEWQASIVKRVSGKGCPVCANRVILRGYNDLETLKPELIKEWNYEKNGILKPSQVGTGTNLKVWWICSKGHEWQADIHSRVIGRGCPICSNKLVLKGYNDLQTKNPELAKEWNYEKNGDLKPCDVMFATTKKVWWKCKNTHEWEASIRKRNEGTGCPICYMNKTNKR